MNNEYIALPKLQASPLSIQSAQRTNLPHRLRVLASFSAIYLIWGSTFLATRFAIQTIPAFLMVTIRFLVAGGILYVWARLRGEPRPTAANWRASLIVGALLFVGGMGIGAWAMQFVPSGLAAVLIATASLWMVLLDWLWLDAPRPGRGVFVGLLLGLAGIVLIVGPDRLMTLRSNQSTDVKNLIGIGVLLLSALAWAAGSVYTRRATLPTSSRMASGMQMLTGAAMLLLLGAITGDFSRLNLTQITLRSALSLAYLAIFGSLIAFSAYFWLLRVSTPTRVSSYAYVNPITALLLGWALGNEPLTARTLLACAIILIGVALITTQRVKTAQAEHKEPLPEASLT